MQQKQHVDYHRKIGLRKRLLLAMDKRPARCYVPFIGDGDIAADLYSGLELFGADIEPERVAVAQKRLRGTFIVADCDHFPFKGSGPFDVADFDAYSYPYKAFRSFWEEADKSNWFYFPKVVLPWFTEYIAPYRILQKAFYLRLWMLYWGVVIERA